MKNGLLIAGAVILLLLLAAGLALIDAAADQPQRGEARRSLSERADGAALP